MMAPDMLNVWELGQKNMTLTYFFHIFIRSFAGMCSLSKINVILD